MPGDETIRWLAGALAALDHQHVPRVAIDGPDAAGKTWLADGLADLIRASRPVIRLSADGFQHPAEVRYRRGDVSAEGYYLDSFDHQTIAAAVLRPLGPGGDLAYLPGLTDSRPVPPGPDSGPAGAGSGPPGSGSPGSGSPGSGSPGSRPPASRRGPLAPDRRIADPRALLLFDGVFLQRAGLRRHWDFVVYLQVTPEESLRRALIRDIRLFGTPADVEHRYRRRYLPGQGLYRLRDRPAERADVVLDMSDPGRPAVLRSAVLRAARS